MNQISMSGVDFNHPETGFAGATCGLRERSDYLLNAGARKRVRQRITIGERQRTGGHDLLPAPCMFGHCSVTFPRPVRAGFASGVRQLHAGDAALLMNEPDDSSERLNVIVIPDAKILRTDAALGKNGRGLGKHQSSSTHCTAAQVDEMPVVRVPVRTGVLAHRRDKHTVRKREATNGERVKQVSHRSSSANGSTRGDRLRRDDEFAFPGTGSDCGGAVNSPRPPMNLILLESGEVSDSGDVTLAGARADHMVNVLNIAPGHQVRVAVLDGPYGVGTVQSIGARTVALRCAFDTAIPPRPRVDLLLALPRPKVMRRLWAQIAALCVGQIILTNAARVERNYFDTHVLTPQCYGPLLIEGLQQARDTRRPNVSIHRQFRMLVEDDLDGLFPSGLRLAAHPAAQMPTGALVRERVRECVEERILLAVGPEGGWNDFETALLEAHGFRSVSMGPRTLRTSTACIALLALVHDAVLHTRTTRVG